jgi:signal transduction histidine kinase
MYVPNMVNDTVKGIFVLGIDVTEQKQMEQQLLRFERLAAIGETAAMVGHDLRNPLQAMSMALCLAKKLTQSAKQEDRKDAVAMLDKLDEQIQYMGKIISNLQDYSGRVTAEPIEVDLTELMKDALSNVNCPQNVETTLAAKNASRVSVDPVLMKRIIVNLVENAVQAMPDGGKVVITGVKGPRNLSVIVQDTGVGIPPEDTERMFTPFFTKKVKGQGLGLAACKRLVEAQGGTIIVKSKLGHGSTFTVTIPTQRAPTTD